MSNLHDIDEDNLFMLLKLSNTSLELSPSIKDCFASIVPFKISKEKVKKYNYRAIKLQSNPTRNSYQCRV